MFSAGKTRMIGLQHAEESMMICLTVSMQHRNVTDGETDRQTYRIAISILRISIAALTRDKNSNNQANADGCNSFPVIARTDVLPNEYACIHDNC